MVCLNWLTTVFGDLLCNLKTMTLINFQGSFTILNLVFVQFSICARNGYTKEVFYDYTRSNFLSKVTNVNDRCMKIFTVCLSESLTKVLSLAGGEEIKLRLK